MNRKLAVISCVLWISGVAAVIVGLNLEGDAGTWVTVAGNIAFLLGLGLQGVLWLRKRKEESARTEGSAQPPENPEKPGTPDNPG